MKKIVSILAFLVLPALHLFYTNQVSAHPSKQEEIWEVEVDKEYQPITSQNQTSFADYITAKNILATTAVVTVGFATYGFGLAATAKYLGYTAAPSIGQATLSGALIGASTGLTVGGTAWLIKKLTKEEK